RHPPVAEPVAQVEVGGGAATVGAALAGGGGVLEGPRGQAVAADPIGAVEFPDLAEGAVGDEVHRILAILHWDVEGELAQGVDRVESDDAATAVGLDGPAGTQLPREGHVAQHRRPGKGTVGDREAAKAPAPGPG